MSLFKKLYQESRAVAMVVVGRPCVPKLREWFRSIRSHASRAMVAERESVMDNGSNGPARSRLSASLVIVDHVGPPINLRE